ncbi:glycosyltransferase family 4 protein [Candidatus Saccharibacteria bacterium]|nr:glycosyltransferase family 4 protein [Candidatus Saccharibacteria bacterium]
MRIGISLLDFQPNKSGGIETYCRDLISGLETIDQKNEYYVLLNLHNAKTIKVGAKNFYIVYADKRSFARKVLGKLGKRVSNEELMSRFVENLGLDLLHFPLQTVQPYLLGTSVKKIVSIMDIQQEYFPEFFDKKDLAFRRKAYKQSCDSAVAVISISEFTKQCLVQKLSIAQRKIITVHLNYNASLLDKKSIKRSTDKPYFYYPAATWPHKNHLRLLQAFSEFSKEYPNYQLVLTGIKKQKGDEVQKYINKNNLGKVIKSLGYVDNDELPGLYQNAFGLIFPSLFEGFGIPVVDAMVCGCPVICSNTTSLPEVGGNAVLYCNPQSIKDIALKMTKLAENEKLRANLIKRGRVQAKKFTKEKMVKNTLKVYEKVARM